MPHIQLMFLAGLGFSMLVLDSLATRKKPKPPYRMGKQMNPRERAENMKQAMLLSQALTKEVDPSPPLDLIAAIMHIESGFNPTVVNLSDKARQREGAWGIAQVTLSTAKDYARRFPEIGQKLWPKFNGTGESLKDVATNLGFAIYYLSRAYKQFNGDWYKTGVSYHQGKGTVTKLAEEYGDDWSNHLPPFGRRYYQLLQEKHAAYTGQTAAVSGGIQEPGTGSGGGGHCPLPKPPGPTLT